MGPATRTRDHLGVLAVRTWADQGTPRRRATAVVVLGSCNGWDRLAGATDIRDYDDGQPLPAGRGGRRRGSGARDRGGAGASALGLSARPGVAAPGAAAGGPASSCARRRIAGASALRSKL